MLYGQLYVHVCTLEHHMFRTPQNPVLADAGDHNHFFFSQPGRTTMHNVLIMWSGTLRSSRIARHDEILKDIVKCIYLGQNKPSLKRKISSTRFMRTSLPLSECTRPFQKNTQQLRLLRCCTSEKCNSNITPLRFLW